MKNKVRGSLPPSTRRAVNTANRRERVAQQMKRNDEIRVAQAAAAAAPRTAANIAFEARLARRADEIRALQNSHRDAQNEIRRQRHVNSAQALAARALLNAEDENDEIFNNGEINSRNALNPVIRELQSQLYALEHAIPINPIQIERARAMLEVAESQQMLERIEDELPRLIEMYGEDSPMVADMYDTQQQAHERSVDAITRLEALPQAGGKRKTRKHKRNRRV